METESIEFEYKCNDHVCTLIWWYFSLNHKNRYFLRPGAAMIREMDDYWIFILFSNDTGDRKTYEPEMNSLGHIIEDLNQRITWTEELAKIKKYLSFYFFLVYPCAQN